MKKPDFDRPVFALLEEIELAAACCACGRLSLYVLGGEACPHCYAEQGSHAPLSALPKKL